MDDLTCNCDGTGGYTGDYCEIAPTFTTDTTSSGTSTATTNSAQDESTANFLAVSVILHTIALGVFM